MKIDILFPGFHEDTLIQKMKKQSTHSHPRRLPPPGLASGAGRPPSSLAIGSPLAAVAAHGCCCSPQVSARDRRGGRTTTGLQLAKGQPWRATGGRIRSVQRQGCELGLRGMLAAPKQSHGGGARDQRREGGSWRGEEARRGGCDALLVQPGLWDACKAGCT